MVTKLNGRSSLPPLGLSLPARPATYANPCECYSERRALISSPARELPTAGAPPRRAPFLSRLTQAPGPGPPVGVFVVSVERHASKRHLRPTGSPEP